MKTFGSTLPEDDSTAEGSAASSLSRPARSHRLCTPMAALLVVLIWAVAALPAIAQEAAELEFSPLHPTSLDPIRVVVSGVWPNDCAPELFDLIVEGSTVRVEIVEAVVLPCDLVPTDYRIEADLPPLAAGEYDLRLINWGAFAPSQLDVLPLTVTASSEASLRSLSVHPPEPNTSDRIQVVAAGDSPDGCVPQWMATQVDGDEIVITTLRPGEVCVQQITPYDVSAAIGPLPAGTYDLTVLVADALGLPEEDIATLGSRSFTVNEAATTNAVLDDRFRVSVSFEDQLGVPEDARVLNGVLPGASEVAASSGETALFWFFSPDNTELVVKVLDGCAINQRYWVFASAATDLAFTLTVTDLENDTTRTYENLAGEPATAINDTDAFATCSP